MLSSLVRVAAIFGVNMTLPSPRSQTPCSPFGCVSPNQSDRWGKLRENDGSVDAILASVGRLTLSFWSRVAERLTFVPPHDFR
jgi:hypothetical protein